MKRKDGDSELVTKGFLKSELEYELGELGQRVDDRAKQYRDQILTSNDKLARTLETMREELGLENLQMKRGIEDHEKRIKHLEKIQQTV